MRSHVSDFLDGMWRSADYAPTVRYQPERGRRIKLTAV